MLYFFKKSVKLSQRWGLRPPNLYWPPAARGPTLELLLPSPFTVTFYIYSLEEVWSANVISVKKEQKELRNITNVLFLPLTSNFAQGTLIPPLAQVSRHRNNMTDYIMLEW